MALAQKLAALAVLPALIAGCGGSSDAAAAVTAAAAN